jgi:hypothetical protein
LRNFKVDRGADEVTFKAPGDDWYDGKADHYRVALSRPCGAPDTQFQNVPATVQAGATQTIELHGRVATVFAVDDAGNRDQAKSFAASCGSRRPAPH